MSISTGSPIFLGGVGHSKTRSVITRELLDLGENHEIRYIDTKNVPATFADVTAPSGSAKSLSVNTVFYQTIFLGLIFIKSVTIPAYTQTTTYHGQTTSSTKANCTVSYVDTSGSRVTVNPNGEYGTIAINKYVSGIRVGSCSYMENTSGGNAMGSALIIVNCDTTITYIPIGCPVCQQTGTDANFDNYQDLK